jgi:hypothetical protein
VLASSSPVTFVRPHAARKRVSTKRARVAPAAAERADLIIEEKG